MSLFIAVISLSVGYASLSSSLLVSGEAHLRVKEEVRVTNLTISEQTSSSYDNNSEYYKNGLILRAVLPSKDSKITYEIELTNNSSVDYYLKSAGYKSIEEDVYTEIDKNTMTFVKGDFKYTITGIKTDDTVIKPGKSTFTITITYKDGLVEVPSNNNAVIDIRYEFDILDKIPPVVTFSIPGGCYNSFQTVRVMGIDDHFNHMDIEVYKNSEKIETKTITYPNNSYDILLNEYTEYTIYVKVYDVANNVQAIGPKDERGYTYQKYLIENANSEYLYDRVKKCAVSDENVDFSQQPTDEEAEQAYYIDTKPIYYYRGPVENNNVIFAGYCWKIVRTTETGGIKLLYSGKPTSDGKCTATGKEQLAFQSQFNTTNDDKKYVGYMYDEFGYLYYYYGNNYNSTIKKNLETWFEGKSTNATGDPNGSVNPDYTDLTQYDDYLEDAVWCNDRTEGNTWENVIYYVGYDRNYNSSPSPSLACPSNNSFTISNENGNGASLYKVGMMTVDELTMGGLNNGTSSSNINTYLSTGSDDISWWTISPSHWDGSYAHVFYAATTLYYSNVFNNFGVRPMVSLKNSVSIETTGDGTKENPYKVITDENTSGKNLYDTMINSAKEIVSDANIDFSSQPTKEDANRLYYVSTSVSEYPIYYYRGPVTNNNIIFGGYCWKIVRTTETGGIKLLYSGKPTNGQCVATGESQFVFNSNFNDIDIYELKALGYMYGEDDNPNENKYDSTIKSDLENWFEDYLEKYEDEYLEDTIWCNDRTIGTEYEYVLDGSVYNYDVFDRNGFVSYNPNLACKKEDSFTVSSATGNGKSRHKVGLITLDEATMGGLNYNKNESGSNSNINTYLYTGSNDSYWWALSPFMEQGGSPYVSVIHDWIYYGYRNSFYGVRPMVSLKHDIKVAGEGTMEEPYNVAKTEPVKVTLYDKIINSATEIVSDEGLDFGELPTDEDATKLFQYSGETSGSGNSPIYYYRGAVTNNNIIFGGYCWKIVRTTATGGIKLIYTGKSIDGKCTTATGKNQIAFSSSINGGWRNKKYIGYMYGDDDNPYENKYDSAIKRNLEAWFEGKSGSGVTNSSYIDLTKYEKNFLEDAVWCNDRTESSTSEIIITYAAYDRNDKYSGSFGPSLACPSNDSFTVSSENGNGKLTHKVGTITADELTMGGFNVYEENINTYLYTGSSTTFWWTISPRHYSSGAGAAAEVFYVRTELEYNNVTVTYDVRPMVSLKPGIVFLKGTGTDSNPYIIDEQEI